MGMLLTLITLLIGLVAFAHAQSSVATLYTNSYSGDVRTSFVGSQAYNASLQGTYYGATVGGACSLRTPSAPSTATVRCSSIIGCQLWSCFALRAWIHGSR